MAGVCDQDATFRKRAQSLPEFEIIDGLASGRLNLYFGMGFNWVE